LAILYKKSVSGEEMSVKAAIENKQVKSPVKITRKTKGDFATSPLVFLNM